MRRVALRLAGSLAVGIFGVAHAADPAVSAHLTASRVVVQADGKETFAAADRARPGDVIEYRVDYHNTTKAGVNDVVATLPIPAASAEYIPSSEVPGGALASIDGRTFAPPPLKRAVKLPNGRTEMQAVPVSEYRFLRWSLGTLPADAHKSVSARVRLTTAPSETTFPSKSTRSP
jgi:uncharacterized repeat protein (TIGR01451 family)